MQTTMGFMGFVGGATVSLVWFSVLQEVRAEADTIPTVVRLEFLRNLRRFMERDVYF